MIGGIHSRVLSALPLSLPVSAGASTAQASTTQRGPSGRPHPPRRASAEFTVPNTRPLHDKLVMVLDAVCQFTWFAGAGGSGPYSEEALAARLTTTNAALEAEDEERRRAMASPRAMLASFMK